MNTSNLLNTSNPHCFVYTTDELTLEILGGLRIDILDRMRVTIKLSKGSQSIRHNLDLYNDTPVDKLIRKTAEKLEIGSILVAQVISDRVINIFYQGIVVGNVVVIKETVFQLFIGGFDHRIRKHYIFLSDHCNQYSSL